MRFLLSRLTIIIWAVWSGGIVTLAILVMGLFRADREIALKAAPLLFVGFDRFQMSLAGLSLLCTILWLIVVRSRWIAALLVGFLLPAMLAAQVSVITLPRMEAIRQAGASHDSPEFRKLHSRATTLYLLETVLLLLSGAIILPRALTDSAPHTAAAAGQARHSPDEVLDQAAVN
jgi:hypothetical protein